MNTGSRSRVYFQGFILYIQAECVFNPRIIIWNCKKSFCSKKFSWVIKNNVPIRLACSHFREGNFTNPVNVFTCIMFHNMIADFRPPKTQGVSHTHWWIESDKYLRERDKNANRPTISKRMQSFPTMGSKLLSNTLSFYRQRQRYIWLDIY